MDEERPPSRRELNRRDDRRDRNRDRDVDRNREREDNSVAKQDGGALEAKFAKFQEMVKGLRATQAVTPITDTPTTKEAMKEDQEDDEEEDGNLPETRKEQLVEKFGKERGEELAKHHERKDRLREKGLEEWLPTTRLSRDEMEKLRQAKKRNPGINNARLAKEFRISVEAVERILESNWRPSPERRTEQDRNKEELRTKDLLNRMAADLQTLNKVFQLVNEQPKDIQGLEHVITTAQSIFRAAHYLQKKEFQAKLNAKEEEGQEDDEE
eukprot:TRINITY_DN4910_c0_g1_i2.p1 TRINITY_DN4910_c0_g1~~TRINITY_DN4910_c0_g1_i2.p1  ORF type:complete len:269 (-),score=112.91 TRINITY_DN4910_c0_g1_i2:24-830(-)